MVECVICGELTSNKNFCRKHLAMIPLDIFRLMHAENGPHQLELVAVASTIIKARLRAAEKLATSPLRRLYDGSYER